DAEAIQRFIRGLSLQSRYQRFLANLRELNFDMLERILSPRAGREIALVADSGTEGVPRIVGLAQLASGGHQHVGEVAVVVAEDWRRAGLATQLLRNLGTRAVGFEFREAYADILRDNTAAIELARLFGAELGASPHGAMLTRVTAALKAQ